MLPFLDEAEELLDIPGSVKIVFDLIMKLASYSYGDMESGSGDGDRPSDSEVDALLLKLAPKRRGIEPRWNYQEILKELKEVADN